MLESTPNPLFDRAIFFCSLVFLTGVLMVAVSMFEGVRARYPQVMLHGFLVSLLSLVMVFVVAQLT